MRVQSEARASQRDNYASRAEARLAHECLDPVFGDKTSAMSYGDEEAQVPRKDLNRVWVGSVA